MVDRHEHLHAVVASSLFSSAKHVESPLDRWRADPSSPYPLFPALVLPYPLATSPPPLLLYAGKNLRTRYHIFFFTGRSLQQARRQTRTPLLPRNLRLKAPPTPRQ